MEYELRIQLITFLNPAKARVNKAFSLKKKRTITSNLTPVMQIFPNSSQNLVPSKNHNQNHSTFTPHFGKDIAPQHLWWFCFHFHAEARASERNQIKPNGESSCIRKASKTSHALIWFYAIASGIWCARHGASSWLKFGEQLAQQLVGRPPSGLRISCCTNLLLLLNKQHEHKPINQSGSIKDFELELLKWMKAKLLYCDAL